MTKEVKNCDCKKKCIAKLQEFATIAGAVFVGATLAILLSANILKPKCPCKAPMMPPPKFERHMPPHMMHHGFQGPREFHKFHGYGPQAKMHKYGEIKARRDFRKGEFKRGPQPPVKIEEKR